MRLRWGFVGWGVLLAVGLRAAGGALAPDVFASGDEAVEPTPGATLAAQALTFTAQIQPLRAAPLPFAAAPLSFRETMPLTGTPASWVAEMPSGGVHLLAAESPSSGTSLAGVSGTSLAGVSGTSLAGVSGTSLAGVSGTSLAGVSGTSLAGVSGTSLAGVSGTSLVGVSKTAGAPPFWRSTCHLVLDYGTSPLRSGWSDLEWAVPSAALVGVTLHNDVPLYQAIATGDARKPWLDHSMPTVSALGDGLMEAGLTAMAAKLGPPRLARTSTVALQALVVVSVWSEVLKVAAWSNRPYEDSSGHYFFDYGQPTQGMPSGHTFSAFAVAEVYGAEYGRWWTYPVAALIGYSRIYNQDHWPSDVAAGAVLGIAAGVQARRAAESGGVPGLRLDVQSGVDGTPLVVGHVPF